jgi:hypothetical protein
MTICYINYSSSKTVLHSPGCNQLNKNGGGRSIKINSETLLNSMAQFKNNKVQFNSKPELNQLYLNVHFNNSQYEKKVCEEVLQILNKHYSRINTELDRHC